MHACRHVCMYACTYGRMDVWMDGWMDMDGCSFSCGFSSVCKSMQKNILGVKTPWLGQWIFARCKFIFLVIYLPLSNETNLRFVSTSDIVTIENTGSLLQLAASGKAWDKFNHGRTIILRHCLC